MGFESEKQYFFDLLLDSGADFPIAFASWRLYGEVVFVSDKFKTLIHASSIVINVYDFSQLVYKYFGNFLYIAAEKVFVQQSIKNEYSALLKSKYDEEFLHRLVFNKIKKVYVYTIEKSQDHEKVKVKNDIKDNIVDSIPIYIWKKNLDLKLIYCNKKYSDALETSQESAISNNLRLVNTRNEKYATYTARQSFIEKVVIKGNRRYLEITEQPLSGNTSALGFAIDVTDREELKKEYKTYKKQTEETLDQISVPIAIFDEKMSLVFANSAIEKLFGLDINLLREKNFSEIISVLLEKGAILSNSNEKEFKEKAVSLFTAIIEPYHTSISLQNGKIMNVTISPNHGGGLIFLLQDISDTIALKREVSSISAVQQETLDHLKEGVVVFGTDNRVKMINSAIENILENKEIINDVGIHIKDFFEKISPIFNLEQKTGLCIEKIINMSTQRVQFSDTIPLSSGKVLDYSYVPLPDGLNLIRFFDATDKANLERALEEKTDIISQIDKIKANLISYISYELRAPLNTIMGFSDILLNQYFGELNEKQIQYCQGIIGSVKKTTEVVNAIINLTSIEVGQIKLKYTEVNLFKFIESSLELFKNRAKFQDVTLKNNFNDEKLTVYFDELSMNQVMFQLISKALKLTPPKGCVSISVEISQSEPDYFNIIVSDTGIGISKEDLEKMNNTLSVGMGNAPIDNTIEFGLVLANNIVHLHNGRITIASEDGQGTVVKCHLPVNKCIN
ncbi:MAG: PAS-domain containing protein [Holosporales bacterium]|jgi:signal transduction histidine kinase/PAS domain-containing protein|nr:PAS-domain containing protein [Holosporales bacterium]